MHGFFNIAAVGEVEDIGDIVVDQDGIYLGNIVGGL
jgi:hypothetical protein